MGKKGDLLRAMKKQQATYTFTGAELEEHDRRVVLEHLKTAEGWMKEEDRKREQHFREAANRVWDERERQFQTGDGDGDMMAYMRCFFAISCRVLIERFGWKVPRTRGRNTKIMAFADSLAAEINMITSDERQDIVKYAAETYGMYGVGFRMDDAEEG